MMTITTGCPIMRRNRKRSTSTPAKNSTTSDSSAAAHTGMPSAVVISRQA